MQDDVFWGLVDELGGSVSDEALANLESVLVQQGRQAAIDFQHHLDGLLGALAGMELVDENDLRTVGDGALSLALSVIATGRAVFEDVRRAGGGRLSSDLDDALELGEVGKLKRTSRSRARPGPRTCTQSSRGPSAR